MTPVCTCGDALEPTDIPIAIVFLARVLARSNPCANILGGVVMTLVQALSVVGSLGDGYYPFFSRFEILATASVVVYAARWIRERRASDSFDSADRAHLDRLAVSSRYLGVTSTLDRNADIYGVRTLNSCRARSNSCSILRHLRATDTGVVHSGYERKP